MNTNHNVNINYHHNQGGMAFQDFQAHMQAQSLRQNQVIEQLRLENQYLKSQLQYILSKQAYEQSIRNQQSQIQPLQIQCQSRIMSKSPGHHENMQSSYSYQNQLFTPVSLYNHNGLSSLAGNLSPRRSQVQNQSQRTPTFISTSPIMKVSAVSQQEDVFSRTAQGYKSRFNAHSRQNSQIIDHFQGRLTQNNRYIPQNSPMKSPNMFKQPITSQFHHRQPNQSKCSTKRQVRSPVFLKNKLRQKESKQNMTQHIRNHEKQPLNSKDVILTRASSSKQPEIKANKEKMMNNLKYMKEERVQQPIRRSRAPSIVLYEQESERQIERELRMIMQGSKQQTKQDFQAYI